MKFSQVKGNTWVLDAEELIPVYRLDERRCILLDSGLGAELEALEQALEENGLTPVGILCSHAHVDHCGNNAHFQKKLGIPVALTAPEAGMCSGLLNLKCYFLTLPPSIVRQDASCMVHTPDILIPPVDGRFSFCGADFHIIQTPGHSSGHICTITPDNVCYVADAVLSYEYLQSKLPYNLSQTLAEESRDKLRHLNCDVYIMAHNGFCGPKEFDKLLDLNNELVTRRTYEILDLVTRPMTASEIVQVTCEHFQLLSKRPRRTLRFERNIRFFIEYLVDRGELEMFCVRGNTFYRRAEEPQGPFSYLDPPNQCKRKEFSP